MLVRSLRVSCRNRIAMATDIEVKNHIIVPCCMKDRTFGAYLRESAASNSPILARTSGDVTAKHYLEYLVDHTPGCEELYVAFPKLSRELIYQLRDMLRMDCRIDGALVKRIPKLYLFSRNDEASGNIMMFELAESSLSGFGERVKVVPMKSVDQDVIAMVHPCDPVAIVGTIPIKAAQKSRLHIVTINAVLSSTAWIAKALRIAAKVKS